MKHVIRLILFLTVVYLVLRTQNQLSGVIQAALPPAHGEHSNKPPDNDEAIQYIESEKLFLNVAVWGVIGGSALVFFGQYLRPGRAKPPDDKPR